jgi:CDP-paratose 2-epimerase
MACTKLLITGGAGFIGANAASRFAREGREVLVLDNLSRRGADENLRWLQTEFRVRHVDADIRDDGAVAAAVRSFSPDAILHLAAQVAVTASVSDPRTDFEINALGTFNVLEAMRAHAPEATLIYASTNKVFGELADMKVVEHGNRYGYETNSAGISEGSRLDFHSPYGCSKGAADQYVLDYSRIFGLRTAAFRQSCIYGPRQFGLEDQGWVAWFTIAAALDKPITVYGNGKQTRDLLYVDDLVDLYARAFEAPERVAGRAVNVGGGLENAVSLLELIALLEELAGRPIPLRFDAWRPGDQKVFVCNNEFARQLFGWTPRTSVREGVTQLWAWVRQHAEMLSRCVAA